MTTGTKCSQAVDVHQVYVVLMVDDEFALAFASRAAIAVTRQDKLSEVAPAGGAKEGRIACESQVLRGSLK